VLVLVVLAAAVCAVVAPPPVEADVVLPGAAGVEVFGIRQIDPDRDGRPDVTIIDCSFATGADRVIVVDGAGTMRASASWQEATDFDDDLWLFEVGATGRASLAIQFARENGNAVAYLYDDQNGDGYVDYQVSGSRFLVTESRHWSLKVTAAGPWVTAGGMLNPNLTFTGDGRAFRFDPWSGRPPPAADGIPDAVVEVRARPDGTPWYELAYLVAPTRPDQSIFRTTVRVNHAPITPLPPVGYAFFPLLGLPAFYDEGYFFETSPAVSYDWKAARVGEAGIFGYPIRQGYYLGGPYAFKKGQANLVGFENPQALYRLAGADPGADPDVHIRVAYLAPHEPWTLPPNGPIAMEQVSYDWRQSDTNGLQWDYKIDVAGTKEITSVVPFPDFGLKVVPYEELPYWTTEGDWAYGTFVAVEDGSYASSEGIYEWYTTEGVVTDMYLPAGAPGRDVPYAEHGQRSYLLGTTETSPGRYYTSLRPGLRGEYADLNGRPLLYLSPIDRRLHLLKASHGVWNVDGARRLRYAAAGDEYVRRWTLERGGVAEAELHFAAGHLLLASEHGISIRAVDVAPAAFTTPPPRTAAEKAALTAQLDAHRAPFAGHDLGAMFGQFSGPVQHLEGASMRDLRLDGDGFRFVLSVPTGRYPRVRGDTPPWARDLDGGEYVVAYSRAGGYTVEPLRRVPVLPADVAVTREHDVPLGPVSVVFALRNEGNEDANAVAVAVVARRGDGPAVPVKTGTLDVPAGASIAVRAAWSPPAEGTWQLSVVLGGETLPLATVRAGQPDAALAQLLRAQHLSAAGALLVLVVFAATSSLAGACAYLFWRGGEAGEADGAARR
jgi:hypothetical protein